MSGRGAKDLLLETMDGPERVEPRALTPDEQVSQMQAFLPDLMEGRLWVCLNHETLRDVLEMLRFGGLARGRREAATADLMDALRQERTRVASELARIQTQLTELTEERDALNARIASLRAQLEAEGETLDDMDPDDRAYFRHLEQEQQRVGLLIDSGRARLEAMANRSAPPA